MSQLLRNPSSREAIPMGFAPLNPSYDPTPDGNDAGSLSFAGRYNINGPQNAKSKLQDQ
jgi:hypothetical protein